MGIIQQGTRKKLKTKKGTKRCISQDKKKNMNYLR
jgi:hypothetical protein